MHGLTHLTGSGDLADLRPQGSSLKAAKQEIQNEEEV